MGFSRETPKLGLPLFNDTDKPSWRGDMNLAHEMIDTEFSGLPDKYSAILTPESFGAVGNGVADDTAALTAMLIAASDGVRIQGQAGKTYRFVSPIQIQNVNGWVWSGGTYLFDSLEPSTQGAVTALTIVDCDDWVFEDARLVNANQIAQYTLARVESCSSGTLCRIVAYDARWVGISIFGAVNQNIRVEDCQGLRCYVGLLSNSPGTKVVGGRYSSEWSLTDEYVDKGGVWDSTSLYYDGIIINGEDWLIDGVTLDDNGQSGVYGGGGTTRGTVQNCHIFANWNKGVDFGIVGPKGGNNVITRLIVSNNEVSRNKTGDIHFAGVDDSVISSNVVNPGATGTNGIVLNGASLRNLIMGNSVVSANSSAAVFINNPTGSRDNKVVFNHVVATLDYTVNLTNNNVIKLNDTDVEILGRLTSPLTIDLTGKSDIAGRVALYVNASADNNHIQFAVNKEVRFQAFGGSYVPIRAGSVQSEGGVTVGGGTLYVADDGVLRPPRTAGVTPGQIWYDANTGHLMYRDAVAGINKIIATTN